MREDTSLSTMRGAAAGRRGQRAASGAPCVRSVSAACPLCVRCVSTCARAPAVRPLYVRCASAVCPLCVGPLYVRPLHAAMTQLADDARRSGNPNRRGAIRTGAVRSEPARCPCPGEGGGTVERNCRRRRNCRRGNCTGE